MKENYKPHAKPYQRIEPVKLMQLQALLTDILEIPGQYDVNQEPSPEKHVKLVEIGKEVECVEKSRMLIRILSFRGTNGKVYQYTINNKPTPTGSQNESLVLFLNSQLKQVMNIRFASNKETAVRNLKLKGLNEFFVNWEVSIAEYKPKLKSMSDLLDDHMVAQGYDTDHALELYLKERIFENIEAKKAIFRQMDKLVPKDLFRKFVLKCVRNLDEYYLFRNNFTASYGMENFFSYIISNEMLLENMFVDAAKGTFYYLDMKPNFTDLGQINRESAQSSIRISKNIENFITNMGLEGPFASCFIAGSLAFTRYDTDLSTLLFVYVRDCVVKGEQGEVPKKVCMDNAVELKARALSFGLEGESMDQISQKIYDIIIELTRGEIRGTIPKKYRYWF
jgi:transformation/transcription domain-associated protein